MKTPTPTRSFPHTCGGELVIVQVGRDQFDERATGKRLAICLKCEGHLFVAEPIARSLRVYRFRADDPHAKAFRNAVRYAPVLRQTPRSW